LGEAELDQRRLDALPVGKRGFDQRLHHEEADHRALLVRPGYDRCRERGGAAVFLGLEQAADQLRVIAQQHRERPRPDAVRVILPEEVGRSVRVHEEVGIDHAAAHQRLGGIVAEAGGIHRLAGDQRRAIVDPRPGRAGAACEPDRQRVRCLAGGVDDPILAADLVHLRRPKVGDVAPLGAPMRQVAFGKDEALRLPMMEVGRVQDGEGVGRIVRGGDEPIILPVLEDRRVAVAD